LISIQTGMLVALGFLLASLLWLLLASAFWSRAVRLTTERLRRSMPVSEAEIKADRDRLRAEYAIRVHRLETSLEQARLERARQLIEINRRDASISALETDVVTIRAELEENLNARRVLEQTVADRLPKVEARLAEAKRILFNRDREIAELAQGARRQKQALEEASSVNAQKAAQIDQLARRGGRRATGETQAEAAVRVEVDALRAKEREQAALIDRLQRRLGPLAPGQTATPPAAAADDDGARATLSEAEAALAAARIPVPAAQAGPSDREREIRALAARAEDQAGEIARLKAALSAFEQGEGGGIPHDSKLALRARAGSAEAQAERQSATISRLRAELAAANERLARQAAHFMDEMNRFVSEAPSAGQGRPPAGRDGRRKLVDRVAQVRPTIPTDAPRSAAASADAAEKPNGSRNGHGTGAGHDIPQTAAAPAGTAAETETAGQPSAPAAQEPAPERAVSPAAAEMPQTATIPEQRKSRLLDRITGLAKS
jgi:hypothetical protein